MKGILKASVALGGLMFVVADAGALTFSIDATGAYQLNASDTQLVFTSEPGTVSNTGGTLFTTASGTFNGVFPSVWSPSGSFTLGDGTDLLYAKLDSVHDFAYGGTTYYFGGLNFTGGTGKYAGWTGLGSFSGNLTFTGATSPGSMTLGGTVVPEPFTLILGAAAFLLGVGRRRFKD